MIYCLTPCRNCEADLSGLLDSARGFADAVIALDDGSTDATAAILDRDPLVAEVLSNPRREGFAGWDDAGNRQRLLDAAIARDADWVVFLDADERIDAGDGRRLREFLMGPDALGVCAYGLELHRMWGERVAPGASYVYRVFAPVEGQRLPKKRLHFDPVPKSISPEARVATSIRVRHLDSPERLEARLAKYRQADPDGAFAAGAGRLLDEPATGDFQDWPPDDPNRPVLAPDQRLFDDTRAPTPTIACLLPARNAAGYLPGWLENVRGFTDLVVALDDGSTDETAELLEADPHVVELLRNPRRDSYEGWDDAENRQRLLDAVAPHKPGWILWLDADERLDPGDAAALRDFVASNGARPGHAYGLRVYRMIDDEDHYDQATLWAYRLFAWEPDQVLPERKLHLVPIPESIPRDQWLRTTLRIKHLSSLDAGRRQARFEKYRHADPDLAYQADYEALLDEPGSRHEWPSRPDGLPVLAAGARWGEPIDLHSLQSSLDPETPLLSVVVISRNDEDVIERSLRAVVDQALPVPFEVIAVVSGTDHTADIVREKFPAVRLVELGPEQCLPGRARNAGLAESRGEYVTFPGSHVELIPGNLAARFAAHEAGHGLVSGAMLNGTDTPAGWATYFLEHAGALPGRPSGRLVHAPPGRCSYPREFLDEIGGFPEWVRAGEDTAVNNELHMRGYESYYSSEIRDIHHSRCTTARRLAKHHYARGRSLAHILRGHAGNVPQPWSKIFRHFTFSYPVRRMRTSGGHVHRWGSEDELRHWRRVRPLVLLGVIAAWIGLWRQLLTPGSSGGN